MVDLIEAMGIYSVSKVIFDDYLIILEYKRNDSSLLYIYHAVLTEGDLSVVISSYRTLDVKIRPT